MNEVPFPLPLCEIIKLLLAPYYYTSVPSFIIVFAKKKRPIHIHRQTA